MNPDMLENMTLADAYDSVIDSLRLGELMADVRLLLSALDVVEEENAELKAENERLKAGLGINEKYREELEALKAELAEIRQSQRDAYKHSDDLK